MGKLLGSQPGRKTSESSQPTVLGKKQYPDQVWEGEVKFWKVLHQRLWEAISLVGREKRSNSSCTREGVCGL